MLGHGLHAVRLGAIHALADLSREDPLRFHVDAARLLAAFVRNPLEGNEVINRRVDVKPGWMEREDVMAAIAALGGRTDAAIRAEEMQQYRIDLEGNDFSHMDLREMNLSRIVLQDANFYGADLQNVDFSEADLSRCTFSSTDVSGAILNNAKLSGTNFSARVIEDDGTYSELLNDPEAKPVSGLIQRQLDTARDDQESPPKLRHVRDAETKELFFWHGRRGDTL